MNDKIDTITLALIAIVTAANFGLWQDSVYAGIFAYGAILIWDRAR